LRDKAECLQTMTASGILLVIRQDTADTALRIIEAVVKGGITAVEITLTVPNALAIMESAATQFGSNILVGAGTVLDSETARASILAGADFIVGPCCCEAVMATCKRYSKVAIPGAMTPTEILRAAEMGADIVKVFPIDHLGGAKYLKTIKGPLPHILLNPSGNITAANARDFIDAGAAVISVGSAILDRKAISESRYTVLTEKAKEFIDLLHA
jgi:2-dehydro-3-deoxyphosphogluconate aldolase / (4S)-4-hydroxy-2-oxoglutarate aldolase